MYIPRIEDVCFGLDAVDSEALCLGTTEIGLAADLETSWVWIGGWSIAVLVLTNLLLLDLGRKLDRLGYAVRWGRPSGTL